jgi:hypothetical protein
MIPACAGHSKATSSRRGSTASSVPTVKKQTEHSRRRARYCPAIKQEAEMSLAKKAGLLIGVIGAAATVATSAEGGEGGRGKKYRGSPVYIVEQPVVRVVRPAPVYVVPPPVMYAPAPTYYEPMYQRYDRYDQYPSSPSLNINIPLR